MIEPADEVFVLEPATPPSKFGNWPPSDYTVRYGRKLIGRIMRSYYAPADSPWAWSINGFERGRRPHEKCQGFAVDLDGAVQALRSAWTEQTSEGET